MAEVVASETKRAVRQRMALVQKRIDRLKALRSVGDGLLNAERATLRMDRIRGRISRPRSERSREDELMADDTKKVIEVLLVAANTMATKMFIYGDEFDDPKVKELFNGNREAFEHWRDASLDKPPN